MLISCLEAAFLALFASSSKCFVSSLLADILTSLFNSLYCIRSISFNLSDFVWPIPFFSHFLSCMRSHVTALVHSCMRSHVTALIHSCMRSHVTALTHSLCCRFLVPSVSLLIVSFLDDFPLLLYLIRSVCFFFLCSSSSLCR